MSTVYVRRVFLSRVEYRDSQQSNHLQNLGILCKKSTQCVYIYIAFSWILTHIKTGNHCRNILQSIW